LLVYLLLSNRIWDATFRDAFLEETLARQVNWIVKEHGHPELLVLEQEPVSVYRLAATFKVWCGDDFDFDLQRFWFDYDYLSFQNQ
jgi:hypothetical protein